MTKRPFSVSTSDPESLKARLNDIGFAEVDRVMRSHGATTKEIADEFQLRAAHKAVEMERGGREQVRALVLSRASQAVDAIFDHYGDKPNRTELADLGDLVRLAVAEARCAAQLARPEDVGPSGEVWATIEIGPATKALVQALLKFRIGALTREAVFVVPASDVCPGIEEGVDLQRRAMDAFVAPLRAQGFVIGTRTLTSTDALAED